MMMKKYVRQQVAAEERNADFQLKSRKNDKKKRQMAYVTQCVLHVED
jgi:hypothetical protein